jgi:fatty acid desaturase
MLKQIAKEQGKEIDPTIKDAFQQEMLQMSYDHKGGYTASRPKLVFLCIAVLVLIGIWIGWASGSWIACILLPFISWIVAVNIAHDSAHFAFNNTPWINELFATSATPLLFNSIFWYIEHNISHHIHTNEIGKDMDVHHGDPLIRSHTHAPWSPYHKFQHFINFTNNFTLATIAQSILYPIMLLFKSKKITEFVDNYDAILARCTPIFILQLSISIIFIGAAFYLFKWPKAIMFLVIPYIISSLIFMSVTQVSHLQEEAQPEKSNENWMRQMVENSFDYSQDSAFWSLITGGLNMQSLHHCLPAVDSSQLFELYPKFRSICEKHGVKINEAPTFLDAIKKYWSHIYNLSKEPIKTTKGEGCPYAAVN